MDGSSCWARSDTVNSQADRCTRIFQHSRRIFWLSFIGLWFTKNGWKYNITHKGKPVPYHAGPGHDLR